ncbi:hypothetical protein B0H17DRAFT_1200574 [Mycena rosella]|uniref:Uncharacterized protein n=1 Tax=Mycena rosella TaxID=1033263 RepID=A0AAD7DIU2_MYCRO|nr:hypothetical protein B0H17DRAFT_1200574 [Mycena rosella]
MLRLLFPCCIRPVDDDYTVIPNENSHLISGSGSIPSPGLPDTMTVDHRKLNDRLGTIVRSKEGKMVNLGSRTPFTMHSAGDGTSSPASPTSAVPPTAETFTSVLAGSGTIPASVAGVARRPLVLTMTPARSRATLHADSRYSSPSGSRSSSRPRSEPADRSTYHEPSSDGGSGQARKKKTSTASEWLGDSESESTRGGTAEEDKAPTRAVTIASPLGKQATAADKNTQSIAFSWSDT